MKTITKKDFISYAVLPGFRQRFSDLFGTGFQYIPYFIALVYGAVRLLPPEHVYLNSANIGRYGIRHVLAEAANNIVFSRNNIDQIFLFVAVLVGLVLVALQIGLLAFGFLMPVANAMPTNFAEFFLTPGFNDDGTVNPGANPSQDLASMMLDMVFGVPELFNSCVSTADSCTRIDGVDPGAGTAITSMNNGVWMMDGNTSGGRSFPFPIHNGMHQLFRFYNIGLTVVAVFLSTYFIITVILETAQTGTPFGKRFNKVWAPIRFVVAFGLLFPLSYGYNAAQYTVFYAAKFGSGFASNGWNMFYDTLTGTGPAATPLPGSETAPTGTSSTVVTPESPDISNLIQGMFVAKTCMEGFMLTDPPVPKPLWGMYVVKNSVGNNSALRIASAHEPTSDFGIVDYVGLLNFQAGDGKVIIRFGFKDEVTNKEFSGFVAPTCGEMTFDLYEVNPMRGAGTPGDGIHFLQINYFRALQYLWNFNLEADVVTVAPTNPGDPAETISYPRALARSQVHTESNESFIPEQLPTASFKRDLTGNYNNFLAGIIDSGVIRQSAITDWQMSAELKKRGWAGAGIWYNKISNMNGAFLSAAQEIPQTVLYPAMFETIYSNKRASEEAINFPERFSIVGTDSTVDEGLETGYDKIYLPMYAGFKFWDNVTSSSVVTQSSIPMVDVINALFGTEGLFNMRKNQNVHPLAQLSGVGRSLVEGSIRNLSYAAAGGAMGTLGKLMGSTFGAQSIASLSGFIVTFAIISLTMGFILYYVVPFLPFIYFFFALGGWIKSIFEAMVGAPLWALAHIRIDGNGLSGQAAVNGYFLIFEIFLRPILIVFGLLASMSIFSALVSVLNQIFDLVVSNVAGFSTEYEMTDAAAGNPGSKLDSMRSALDKFFYTVIYTIIVYLMGMSSFKLVDLIPNNILRWMGQSVTTFGDQQEDIGQSLMGRTYIGTQQGLGALGGGLQSFTSMGK